MRKGLLVTGVLFVAAACGVFGARACSRVTWLGPENAVITGRSMDWPYSFNSTFYLVPRGVPQKGAGGPNSIEWVPKMASLKAPARSIPVGRSMACSTA